MLNTNNQRIPSPIQLPATLPGQPNSDPGDLSLPCKDYWQEQFAATPIALELPTDHPRSAHSTHNSTTQHFTFAPHLTEALHTFSQREQVPLQIALLVAFQLQLHHYTGQDDLIISTNASGYTQTKPGSGNFNVLFPLRCNLAENPTIRTLLKRTQQAFLTAAAHLDYASIGQLEKLYADQTTQQPQALFQVQLTFDYPLAQQHCATTSARKPDLALHIEQQSADLACQFTYNTDLFDTTTIVRISGHLQTILETMQADPEHCLADVSLLTKKEQTQILHEWNATQCDYDYTQCLHQLVEAQVALTPQAAAVLCAGAQLSYQELNERANQLANHLQRSGVGPDVLVGVYMERSFEMVIALLGILKAGGAYVPLDPTYPAERLIFMLEDLLSAAASQQLVLLTQEHLLAQLPVHRAHTLCLDRDWAQIAQEETGNLNNLAAASNLAYAIYTSGSTGRPKGALNTHRGICNRLLWMQEAYQLTASDAVLQKTPFSFDVSVWEFFWPLLAGARLVVAAPEAHKDSAYLVALIQEQGITTMHFVPSMLQVFLEEPDIEACTSLRQVICSGEALSLDLQKRFFTRISAALYNLYGPTEAAIDVTHWTCQRNTTQLIVPIGYPIANTQLYILNRYRQPVPVGVQGELYIGGAGVARGYLNRPELTSERFISDPFSTSTGAQLYRSGDLARYLPDGAIEYLGRLDQQIKLRGFRIELGEVEAVLTQHPTVREVVVTVREDIPGDKRLVAYIVWHKDHSVPTRELQHYMQQRVPSYMLPSAYVVLPEFPATPSGKVNRQALPAPDSTRPDLQNAFQAPRTATEKAITDIWSQVLGIERIGIHDNFLELGGHSLLAMQVITQLRTISQIALSLRSFFFAPTIAQLARHIDQMKSSSATSALPFLQALPRKLADSTQSVYIFPASFAQQRLWFLDQLNPDNPAYNIVATFQFHGKLQMPALQQSLAALVQHHEVLRTSFAIMDGLPVQMITPTGNADLLEIDLQHLTGENLEVALQHALMQDAAKPFNLSRNPLWRVTVFHLAAQRHRLALIIHHTIADGWSMAILFRELSALYTAYAHGQTPTLPDLVVQYADFAHWQRTSMQEGLMAEHLSYWIRQLAAAPEMLELPTDRPRPVVPTLRGATHTFTLSSQLTAAIKTLSRQEGVTFYITVMAAFQILLHRYTGQEDLIIGTATADRQMPETQGLPGLFLNTLALRTNFAGQPSVRDILRRVRDVVWDAHEHQAFPFDHLIQNLQLERTAGRSPLFQVALQLDPPSEVSAAQWTLTRMAVSTGASKFDLSLELDDHPDGLIGHLEYSTDLFDAPTIARMADHWQMVLEGMQADPAQAVANLPLLTQAEYEQIVEGFNATALPYARELCLHQLFEEQVTRTPLAVAVVFEESSLTYQELNIRSNQLARHLRSTGVGPDVLVAICIERSLAMLIGLLGILKAGGAYVPLDPSYPRERIAFMLEDAHVAVLVTQHNLLAQLPAHATQVICIDTDQVQFTQLSASNLTTFIYPEQLAYVIYTSGSTGRPKGVQISQRALVNFLLSMRQEPGLSAQDTLLAVTTLSFDIAGLELYLPLIVGARLIIASRAVATSGTALAETLTQTQTTVMQATPITWRMLLAAGWQGNQQLKILCGGEALQLDLALQLVSRGSAFYNMYGPTETTIWSTLSKIDSTANFITIGRPIANTTTYILDNHLLPVPVGIPGELYIGGDGLARGYLYRPELTAERFIRHPFSNDPTARIYKTGDLARYHADGTIEMLGRVDHQVKLRGFRIELGEIESVLEQHPAIQQAVALVREDQPDDKRLVAYLLPHDGQQTSIPEMQQQAMAHLPAYMLPSIFMFLDAVPQTPNGKVDRRALPAPDLTYLKRQASFVTPRTELEEVVANVWANVLRLPHVGIHDNFFALGGHSLLIMQVTSQLRTALQVELPLRSFFDAPSVAQIVELIVLQQASGIGTRHIELHAQPRQKRADNTVLLPASFAQQALWFLDQMGTRNANYNLPATIRLRSPLHVQTLQRSLDALVQRHESLRTTFTLVDGKVMQVIAAHCTISIQLQDLQSLPDAERETIAHNLAMQELQRSFDLTHGPLLRATLLQLAANDHMLLLVIHHSISDGWSINLLLRDITTLYDAFVTDRAVTLPVLTLQFADFVCWQQAALQGEVLADHLAYWKQQLAGAPTLLKLPTDHPRPANPTHRGAMHTFVLSKELTTALHTLSRQEHVTLYMTLVAAFVILLQRYSGQDDLLLGTTVAGRTHSEIEAVSGYFANTLVLRTNLADNPTVRDLLQRVRETTLSAHAYQDISFDMLVKELQPDRSSGQSPLFQAFLTLDPHLPEVSADWDISQLDLATGGSKFDLSLELAEGPRGIIGHLEYSTELFDASTITRMADHWKTLLQAMVEEPAQHITTLPLLTPTERQRLLIEWNATQMLYPREASIAHLFVQQVERTPTATAVIYANTALAYQDLNKQANQLARYLQQQGMQPTNRIGLCVERSIPMVIALLAILKVGCVYVPLDPTYPFERLSFMLADAQVAALITQQGLSLPDYKGPIIYLDSTWPEISKQSTANIEILTGGTDLAYMLYTSGSTGTPKGVLGTQRACINRFNWMWRTYPFAADEVCCQKTTLSFVDAVWEIFGPLLQGIKLVLIPAAVVKDPQQLIQTLAAQRVTRIVLVPSLLQILLDHEAELQKRLPALKHWICSGESLSLELAQRFQRQMPESLLLNLYGSSEVAADATYYEVRNPAELTCVPIGRPIDNTQIYLLDQHMQLVAPGNPGELHIGGDGLARGYFNRAAMTEARFIAHPFSFEPEARLYKTGDWARYLPDGNLEYLGRLDQQIKLRGMRIELGEIEAVLSQYPALREAVVLAREDVPGDTRLAAYIVPQPGQRPTNSELLQHLSTHLPAYMLPTTFVQLGTLPLTHNGKVDRHALPAPDTFRKDAVEYTAPETTIHHQLVQIWEELLNIHPIGIRDDFFALGGHSFLAIRLMTRLEQISGKKLPLATLMAGATIEHLACAIQAEEPTNNTRTPMIAVQASGSKQPFFFLHGDWQGHALYCLKLAQALGEDQPFYILETYKYTDLKILPSLEEIAATYVTALRSVQPQGPYRLGGWCNGAVFAYEMAQQLQAAGQQVEILVMMDPGSSTPSGRLIFKAIQASNTLLHLGQEQQVAHFLRWLHIYEYTRLWKQHKKRAEALRRTEQAGAPAEIEAAHPNFQSLLPTREALRQNYISIFNWWASHYQARPYTGKLAVFWTAEDGINRRKDWSHLLANLPDVETYMVPGTHVTSRTLYAEALAESLRTCLRKVETAE